MRLVVIRPTRKPVASSAVKVSALKSMNAPRCTCPSRFTRANSAGRVSRRSRSRRRRALDSLGTIAFFNTRPSIRKRRARTAKVFPQTCYGKTSRSLKLAYGVGAGLVVVVVLDDSVVVPGVPSDDEVVVVLELVLVSELGVAEGFTIVVLVSVFVAGVAEGVTSVFCSHAARSAATARIGMYFFISF